MRESCRELYCWNFSFWSIANFIAFFSENDDISKHLALSNDLHTARRAGT
jgi:hypothetical protein